MSDYADRLDPQTYADDLVVAVYRDVPSDGIWVPEQVFWRLVYVAKGYSLHLLPLLGGSDPVQLSRPMIQTFIDEVSFVADRLQDPVVELWAGQLLKAAQAALWQRGDVHLTVEGE
ncbi:hypothetical protein [Micromonospora sp. NPDC005299]|uniref:hypothetical protein n=1 Tax=Micromonospora sp. NPDC005299 TaxID=3364231 RepID=UPI0036A3EC4A